MAVDLPYRVSKSGRAFSDDQEKLIAQAYQEDTSWTHRSLGEKIGVCGTTVRDILRRQGVLSRNLGARGPRHAMWKGGVQLTQRGYEKTWIPEEHPFGSMRSTKGYVLTHRLRMAEHLNRPLRPDETVHHIDGNKLNNDLDNLQLRTGSHGAGVILRCLDCGSTNFEPQTLG